MRTTYVPPKTRNGNGHAARNGRPTALDPRADVDVAARGAPPARDPRTPAARAESMALSFGLFGVFALILSLVALIAVVFELDDRQAATPAGETATAEGSATGLPAAVAADDPAAQGIGFEKYERPDPTLPAVPGGEVKRFTVDVYEHVTKVSNDLAPTRVWSFGVNGNLPRGTGVSAPIVVNEGDRVEITLRNGTSEEMAVTMPHSIDFHSAEVAPNVEYVDIGVGETKVIDFTAEHPGVFMYHCATQPVLMHTGAGMVGMMVVKPAGLQPVDHEFWFTQQEYYLGAPGADGSFEKMQAKQPDVVAFNGYASQYLEHPIEVGVGETVRAYVLDAGPSLWSAFHVIGTVFDRTHVEGVEGRDSQTINLAPSQGGWVEFTLDKEGTYPFVTHAFGDAARGAVGAFTTPGAAPAAHSSH